MYGLLWSAALVVALVAGDSMYDTLFFVPHDAPHPAEGVADVICPDQMSSCPDGTTCCQLAAGGYGCCPLPKAVCCSDHAHCCPEGSKCDLSAGTCNKAGISQPWHSKVAARPITHVVCPDHSSSCPTGSTCCQTGSGQYGCCPLPEAVCCSDHLHCCPSGYTCDTSMGTCQGKLSISIPWYPKLPSSAAPLSATDVVCPGGKFQCPIYNTCCLLADQSWGCCPVPKAVCCSDGEHCCPENYKCDVKHGTCLKSDSKLLSWVDLKMAALKKMPKAPQAARAVKDINCPDGHSTCPEGTTCCKMQSGQYGCCPMPNAVCCSDHLHCCSSDETCDVEHGTCKSGKQATPWKAKFPAQTRNMPKAPQAARAVKDINCPDGHSTCPEGTTCCKMQSGQYGCCPMPNAVCCSDHLHCCSSDETCDVEHGTCKSSKQATPWKAKFPAQTRHTNADAMRAKDVICPDQSSSCPQGSTCCQLSSGGYGCCPVPNAVCCSDHLHCCPNGYTCDTTSAMCNPAEGNGESLPWKLTQTSKQIQVKTDLRSVICPDQTSYCPDNHTCCQLTTGQYGCCPYTKAVCCSDHLHCCPNGYTCDTTSAMCNPAEGNGESLPWKLTQTSKQIQVKTDLKSVICPDQTSYCPDNHTCCQLTSGQYGCCPLPDAVCCSDHLHCCPNGYTCDTTSAMCNPAEGNGESLPWKLTQTSKQIQVKTDLRSVICPDQTSFCPDNHTCCQLTSGQYGCCPYPKAVCCSDHLHCCPNGYTCDTTSAMCNPAEGNGESLPWKLTQTSKQIQVKTDLKSVICPDQTSYCPDNHTCCQLTSGQYGCCPLPNAVCCSDHLHCCPNGYTCDTTSAMCNPAEGNGESLPWKLTQTSKQIQVKSDLRSVICPDQTSYCPDNHTCCQLTSGQYGCCPLPNAVCCSDHLHCCPNGYTCDTTSAMCNPAEGNGESLPWKLTQTSKQIQVKRDLRSVICPDQTSYCPDNHTCCQLTSGQYGCCPLPDAVCCSDHTHCCPSGYTCDVTSATCNPSQKNAKPLPWRLVSASSSLPTRIAGAVQSKQGAIVCPDKKAMCPDGSTCCRMAGGGFGCCPLPRAVCCADNTHCCPDGYRCDTRRGACLKSYISLPWVRKQAAKPIIGHVQGQDVKCDAQSSCQDGQTCCKLMSGNWGCCPLPKAVCCSDGLHCCPENSKCDPKSGTCQSTISSLTHTATYLQKSKPIKVQAKLGTIECKDGTVCKDGNTCCEQISGDYACCPYVNGKCCKDKVHCCPIDSHCNDTTKKCDKDILSFDWASHVHRPAIKPKVKDTTVKCKDGSSTCPDSATCCQMKDGKYGCCPLPNAICCSDKEHCCPGGTTCDTGSGRCIRSIPWYKKTLALPVGSSGDTSSVECPDKLHKCPSDQTCCKLSTGEWGCCPMPQAVCCSDGKHCCPSGYRCNDKGGTCDSGLTSSTTAAFLNMALRGGN